MDAVKRATVVSELGRKVFIGEGRSLQTGCEVRAQRGALQLFDCKTLSAKDMF